MADDQDNNGSGDWLTDFGAYLGKNPNASDDDLFKQFPQLNKDSRRLDAAFSYLHGKSKGMTDDDAKRMYPDLVGPAQVFAPKEASPEPPKDFGRPAMPNIAPARESTGFGSDQINRQMAGDAQAATNEKKINDKYSPMLDKAMSIIDQNKKLFVSNKRPALDFMHDAPDNFYDVPNTKAIDEMLKNNFDDTDTRYWLRNKILSTFQQHKDAYNTADIARTQTNQLPAVQQARKEAVAKNGLQTQDDTQILARANEIDPETQNKVGDIQQQAVKTNQDNKNEWTRSLMNNSTYLNYDDNGNLQSVNTLNPDTPFHDQITGAGKAIQGFVQFTGDVGSMAAGLLKFSGAKEAAYGLQKTSDDFKKENKFPEGDQTLPEYLAGNVEPMMLQGEAMGRLAHGLGAPAFKLLSGAAAKGLIGRTAEGALGGVALAPINSALISHDYYNNLIQNGENPEIAHAKAQRVFDKNLVTDMAISPVQFGIMNAPVTGPGRLLLQYGVSPAVAGAHFMAQDYFQQKENNPALTAWQYASSEDGLKTGLSGALTGLLQHYVIGKMNDWQNTKNVKDALSFGRKENGPETAALPNNNVIAQNVLSAIEMKDSKNRPNEVKGLVDDLHSRGVYNDQEAQKIKGIVDDVAAVRGQIPQMGSSAQRMAVFNELLNQKAYQDLVPGAGNKAVTDMLDAKIKESDQRIQKIMNEEEPLYFINGLETRKDQLMEWAKQNPDLLKSNSVKVDVIGDDATKDALAQLKIEQPEEEKPLPTANTPENPGALPESKITEVRHGVTNEDEKGVTSGPTSVPLNDEGRAKAEQLADNLQEQGIGKAISSALPRAVETAKIVADKLGIPHEQMPELNSWNIGDFDKMPDTEFKKAEKYFVQNPDEKEFEGKKIGESFNEYKDRVIQARQKIEQDNQGHTLVVNHGGNINAFEAHEANGGWNDQAAKDYLNAKDVPPAELPAAPNKTLPERTPEFSDFYHNFKSEIGSVQDSSFDYRVEMPQSQADREKAVTDIEAGKNSKRSKAFLDELQRQYDNGTIEYTRGRGNHVEKFGIPVKDWIETNRQAQEHVLSDIDEGHISDAELHKWLTEEAEKTFDNEASHESGDSAAADKDAKLLPEVPAKDAAKAGDRANPAEDEPRPAGHGAEGPVREAGKGEAAKPVQDENGSASEDREYSELSRDLAGRLGKKLDRITPIDVDGKPNSVEQYKTKAEAVLKQLFPDHSIRWYNSEADYREQENRPEGSAGVYDPKGKYIAFNLERIRANGAENTIFHEVIHPIVQEALQSRKGAVDDAYSKLVELKDIPGMEAVWQHEEQYRSRGLDTMKVEAITEFLTHVADGRIDPENFKPAVRTRIVDAVNRIFKALGIKKVFSTAQDIGKLATSIKSAFDQADAAPIKDALGDRGGDDGEKMDKFIGKPSGDHKEDFVREKLDEYKEKSIEKALREVGGMSQQDAQALIEKVRNERTHDPKEIIKDAMAIGKSVKKQSPLPNSTIKQVEPGLRTTLKRWYYDGVDQVSDAKSIIRKNKGEEEFAINQIYHATQDLVNMWNRVPAVDQMAFMLGVEKPELLNGYTQEYKDMAKSYRDRMDQVFDVISTGIPGLNYIHDYFPHFWEKPDEMRNFMANALSKAPLEGGKGFAKKRFFETLVSGLRAGYKLSTTNPEEMVRLAEANAWKFKTAKDILSDMDDKGLVQLAPMGEGPAGWQTVKDDAFQSMAMRMKSYKTGDSKMAALYMPPDVAKLMNDYLSPGIKSPVKTFIQQYNNVKNLFQLGVGFFHLGTTSLDSMVSGMTNGIQKLSTGNPKGLLDLATLGNLPATLARGFKARADYNKGIVTKDTQALIDANARVGKQKMYALDAKYNMMKAFGRLRADGDFKQIGKIAWNAMLYLPEALNKPLMEHYVPALKVGGYLRALDSELSSRKNLTPEQLQNAKQKIWDSMDDRLGQVVYDNLFMKKAYKDMAFMGIRSAGWTGGTLRAVSGGVAEIPRSASRLVSGQGLSQRTAYLMALPTTVGIMGGMLHYLMTGKPPDELKDYFFPKDGTKNTDGTDHRVDLPSYMKDILAYSKNPVKTLLNKTAPGWNELIELYNNKDYYGEKVYNKDDPAYIKGLDVLKYEAQSMEPFSFKKTPYDNAPFADQFTTRQGLEQKFGIMPAPKERERTETQNKITEAYKDQMGTEAEGKTHEEMEQSIARRHLRDFLHDGGDYKDASDEWKKAANVSPHTLGKFIHDAKMDPYERQFRDLKPDEKIKLYEQMSDEEKAQYGKWIPAKLKTQLAQ